MAKNARERRREVRKPLQEAYRMGSGKQGEPEQPLPANSIHSAPHPPVPVEPAQPAFTKSIHSAPEDPVPVGPVKKGIWRSIFGRDALFRWDVLGAIIPGVFIAVGVGMLTVDWFPYHLLVSQVCFGVAGLLVIAKTIGHAAQYKSSVTGRAFFAVIISAVTLIIVVPTDLSIEEHKRHSESTIRIPANQPPAKSPNSTAELTKQDVTKAVADALRSVRSPNPLIETQIKDYQAIDSMLLVKDEVELRETFDFYNILKYNVRLVRSDMVPALVTPEESKEISDFFKGGHAVGDVRYLKPPWEQHHKTITSLIPGKVVFVNSSPKYANNIDLLRELASSTQMPSDLSKALKDFIERLNNNLFRMIDSLNQSITEDHRNIIDAESRQSEFQGSASSLYFKMFIPLEPATDPIRSAIKAHLQSLGQ
jgi:hypothetical protein